MKDIHSDVIVIGSGILGASLAFHLAQFGIKTLVFEKEAEPFVHASGKNAGMYRQLYRNKQLTEWAVRSRKLWPTQSRKFFQQEGSLILGRDVPNHHQDIFQQLGFTYPSGESFSAVYTETDGLLDSKDFGKSIISAIDPSIVNFRYQMEVNAIKKTASGWEVYAIDNIYQCRWLVIASGAWINNILKPYHPELIFDYQSYARHVFEIEQFEENPHFEKKFGYLWDEETNWYYREKYPKHPLELKTRVGSICDETPANPDDFFADKNLAQDLFRIIQNKFNLPESKKMKLLDYRACFRTYTSDKLPIWGEDSAISDLFWLACFGGFGMSTSFAAAQDAAIYIAKKIEKYCPNNESNLVCGTPKYSEFSISRCKFNS